VDGGINQINACKEILNTFNLNIKVVGLVKNDKHSTNALLDGDTYMTKEISKNSNVFHLLTRIQDEVHRYTINYHRDIRSKGSISSVLDNIPGIGESRKKTSLPDTHRVAMVILHLFKYFLRGSPSPCCASWGMTWL
ncbi:MAG: hypothetical protein IIW65_02800, partial [Alistipes sp.]|nr:hypothetical protein [Alistipes sp.]